MSDSIKQYIHISFSVCFILLGYLVFTACKEEELKEELPYKGVYLNTGNEDLNEYQALYGLSDYPAVVQRCQKINLQGKSIAYFGGSLATLPEADVAKNVVAQNLGYPTIVSYGHGGYGFSSTMGSIQDYAEHATKHDIYILWCSTNDYTGSAPLGEPTDYTEDDSYDESKRNTQCGGINYCIRCLRKKNPNALIIGFTSLKFYGKNKTEDEGYTENILRTNGLGYSFINYVDKQIECFQLNGIPYLDQWHLNLFTENNYTQFYKEDGYHMEKEGYFLVGVKQLEFIAKHLNNPTTAL